MKVKTKTTCKIELTKDQRCTLNRALESINKDDFDDEELWFLKMLKETMEGNDVIIKVSKNSIKRYDDEQFYY